MLDRFINNYKANQPIAITGMFRHSFLWLFGSWNDIVYQNPRFQPAAPDDLGTAIYCVHGTGDRNASYSLIAERLLPNLPNHISSIHLVSFDGRYQGIGIEEFSAQLRNRILKNGHTKVILSGHSRGGLVAAHCAKNFVPTDNVTVTHLFVISTPLGGSDFAVSPFTAISTSIAQMQRGSSFLTALNAQLAVSTIPIHCIIATEDSLVKPHDCCPTGPHHQLVLDRHGHLSIMSSHRLVAYIQQVISPPAPDVTLTYAAGSADAPGMSLLTTP